MPLDPGDQCVATLSEMLPEACVAETFEEELDEQLYPDELAAISQVVDKRRNEFRAVRGCARRALGGLGIVRPPLVPGVGGAPTWPPGIVGSMTHCTGYRAAAVARACQVRSLGVDAEPAQPLPDGVLELIAVPEEVVQIAGLTVGVPGVAWDRLLFSAKESVYKTWYPLTQRWLGFEEVRVEFEPDGGFTAALLVPGPHVDGRQVDRFAGRWIAFRGLVLTAVQVPAQDHQTPAGA